MSMENNNLYMNKFEVKRVENGRVIISNAVLHSSGKSVKILEVSSDDREEVERQKRCFQTSLALSSKLFLQGLFCFPENNGKRWVFIYENYDIDLANAWARNWDEFRVYLKQFLLALSSLYEEKNMRHGKISPYNFVINGDRGGLVTGVEGNPFPNFMSKDAVVRDEMWDLRNILFSSLNLGASSKELDMFLDFLPWCGSWKQVFCHPFFLDFQHRCYYFLLANQYLNDYLRKSKHAIRLGDAIKMELQNHQIYMKNWKVGVNRVNYPAMIHILNDPNTNYGYGSNEFLRFARNCVAHLYIVTNGGMCQQAETLVRRIEDSYPAFLCAVHRVFVAATIYIFDMP
ncbi:uncharacterized protein LOC107639766 isoform X1 [Arachis ipaensis]|uniref:uncharacterized protein LOC107639766 isoform X1 n=2 Tax=Arachis ipaensis TaxID=130454 RepID=UPI000A2B3576|nr:uncharacterized protein LOC107639766 isoform X1 [Arachis ipaensis]XP_020961198.1 uncharacterized protein LOC107639766 isoform X1 [Arachis ipaensis]XP_020961199.1 uncharacterized protein LOC107639766 isoform X1 [Arachis ipaensis]